MGTIGSSFSPADRRRTGVPEFAGSLRATVESWSAELEPFPSRWRRAVRVAFITALGAGVMAALQIGNALGLTLLLSFAGPESAFSLSTGAAFLIFVAAIQMVTLPLAGALIDLPVAHLCAFMMLAAVSTYLIYGVRRLGRLWIWAQIPPVTAFYMLVFDRRAIGWDSAQMFGGMALALGIIWLFNVVLWPEPAESILIHSLQNTLERSRRRLSLLRAIFLAENDSQSSHDRGAASKLGYHLALLQQVTREATSLRKPAVMLAAVMAAERIHNEVDRLSAIACRRGSATLDPDSRRELSEAASAVDAALKDYIERLAPIVKAAVLPEPASSAEAEPPRRLTQRRVNPGEPRTSATASASSQFADHL
jgi:hypothetical protein